ncbi:MAG: hypothetical protein AAFQ80_25490 [Cyanobacteria bacterium J06621_8]
MEQEKWRIWQPIEDISSTLYLERLVNNSNGLTITLREDKKKQLLVINFDGYFSYRVTDEGNLLKTLHNIENRECLGKLALFIVENSLYLEWFHQQNYDTYRKQQIIHYLIATPDDVIEVLDCDAPTVKWNL